jgi:membrane protein
MGVTAGMDSFQRRHTWLGFPLAVVYKFVDDQGGYLASLITYYGFLSLFPLLLLLVSVLGYTLDGDPALQHALVGSALQQFPIIGPQLQQNVSSIHGSGLGVILGILGAVYGDWVSHWPSRTRSIEFGRCRVMPAPTWWCPGFAAWRRGAG